MGTGGSSTSELCKCDKTSSLAQLDPFCDIPAAVTPLSSVLTRKDSGFFDLNVNQLSIASSIAIKSDDTGRPEVSNTDCTATVGSTAVKFHGGAR